MTNHQLPCIAVDLKRVADEDVPGGCGCANVVSVRSGEVDTAAEVRRPRHRQRIAANRRPTKGQRRRLQPARERRQLRAVNRQRQHTRILRAARRSRR